MVILAVVAITIVFAAIIVRLIIGLYRGTRGSIDAFSKFSSMSTSPSAFAEEAGWTYLQGKAPNDVRDVLLGQALPAISPGAGQQTAYVRHSLQGELEGHPVGIIHCDIADDRTINVWLIRLQASLPPIGSDVIGDDATVDSDYKNGVMTLAFQDLTAQSPLGWRIIGNYLIGWEQSDSYMPRQLLRQAKQLIDAADSIAQETWRRYGRRP